MHQYKGRLIVHTGSMFSGKTSSLEKDLKRFSIAGYKVCAFKPRMDSRCGENEIMSHDQEATHAYPLDTIDDLEAMVQEKDLDVVGIDEIQFIDPDPQRVVEVLFKILDRGITIIVAGLDMDYQKVPFEIIKELMPRADYVYKHHAVCTCCGSDAWVSHRKSSKTSRVVLGAIDEYEPLCRACYEKMKTKE